MFFLQRGHASTRCRVPRKSFAMNTVRPGRGNTVFNLLAGIDPRLFCLGVDMTRLSYRFSGNPARICTRRIGLVPTGRDYKQIVVRDGKGEKNRVTMLPASLLEPLRKHLSYRSSIDVRDLREGVSS